MALDKNELGTLLHNARQAFNNKTMDELIQEYGTLEEIRLAASIKDAEVIIDYLKSKAEGRYQAGSLQAGTSPVTPNGTIQIKIF